MRRQPTWYSESRRSFSLCPAAEGSEGHSCSSHSGRVKKSNLRQLAQQHLAMRGGSCRCIRCREAGLPSAPERGAPGAAALCRLREDRGAFSLLVGQDETLIGFLRLRLSGTGKGEGASCLRAYASHRQQEKRLAAPRLWGESGGRGGETGRGGGLWSLEITSGIGARGYYRRLGYDLLDCIVKPL